MTANADSRYQMLLHVAAWSRRRCATGAVKSTYTASVSAVEASTPTATSGSSFIIRLHYRGSSDLPSHRKIRKGLPLAILRRSEREKRKRLFASLCCGKGSKKNSV